jgi:thiosulfate reductase cytochrome b subunit
MSHVLATQRPHTDPGVHARWVRASHWLAALSVFTLAVTGVVILMAHPRLYWGEVGNDLTPALLELPISRNHQHGGWAERSPIARGTSAVSASRTYEIFNQNGWGRSLHFLAAWFLVVPGIVYVVIGISSGHFRAHLWPRSRDLRPRLLWDDVRRHLRLQIPSATGGPSYGLLQKCAYSIVVFAGLPLAALTGLAMSPAVTAAYPWLRAMFGGFQSARTIHFVVFLAVAVFVIVHVLMVVKSGFRRHMRAMTLGE